MVLNNYWNFVAYATTYFIPNQGGYTYVDIGLKNISGTSVFVLKASNGSISSEEDINRIYLVRKNLIPVIGSGTTEPEATDYALESPLTVAKYSYTSNTQAENGVLKTLFTITGVNDTNSPITISEIGITKVLRTNQSYSDYTANTVMFIRELLETPYTVAAGAGFTLTYSFDEQ